NYENVDGRTAYKSEAKGLSIGLAQWNDRGRVEASAKVWRYTGNKWSRQSEELPLHRILDLAILIARSMQYFTEESYRYPTLYNKESTKIDRIGLQGDAMTLEVCSRNENLDEDIELLLGALNKDSELLCERLHVLARLLKDMGYAR
ncbi:MAG: hypothetical protein IJO48_02180, partial [Clostridia bacterium]|nr:hypothetical protein [Clostridia bacterium]